jgi:hypothetical protein
LGFLRFNEFSQKLYAYIEARIELVKLETEERIGLISALVIQLLVLGILLGSMLLFLNIALALYINTFSFCQGAPHMGFLLVAGGHFTLMLLIVFLQGKLLRGTKQLVFTVFNRLIQFITKNKF